MSANVIRLRNTATAVKFETTTGVDAFGGAAASAANDFLKTEVAMTFNQQQVPNPEFTGTLDSAASIPGGTKVQLTLTLTAKGSGVAGTPPQWGKLMQCCSFIEQITATPIAASAASAGTVNTATLGTGYTATAQLYRGMPAILAVNPAGGAYAPIVDYTAGKIATFGQTFLATLDATTTIAIPAHVLYKPNSDPTLQKSATINIYQDGLLWKVTGCVGSWKIDARSGAIGTLTFTFTGQFNQPVAATTPTGIVFDAPQPPIFTQGLARLGGSLVRLQTATFDAGNVLYEPDNPEAAEGFDPSVITSRAAKGQFDPLSNITDTIARFAAFKAGAPQTAAIALLRGAGNSIYVSSPRVQLTGESPTNRNDLSAETLPFDCNAPDASIFLAVA